MFKMTQKKVDLRLVEKILHHEPLGMVKELL